MHDVIKTTLVVLHILGCVEFRAILVVADLWSSHRSLSVKWNHGIGAAFLHLPSSYGLLSRGLHWTLILIYF